jgi:hypothetical protein
MVGVFAGGSVLAGTAIGTLPTVAAMANEAAYDPAVGRALYNGGANGAARDDAAGVRYLGGQGSGIGKLSVGWHRRYQASRKTWVGTCSRGWAWGASGSVPVFAESILEVCSLMWNYPSL